MARSTPKTTHELNMPPLRGWINVAPTHSLVVLNVCHSIRPTEASPLLILVVLPPNHLLGVLTRYIIWPSGRRRTVLRGSLLVSDKFIVDSRVFWQGVPFIPRLHIIHRLRMLGAQNKQTALQHS
jgi:hypothetical protein